MIFREAHDDLERWLELPTASVSDALGRLGGMHAGIARLSGSRLAGRAYPVWTAGGDNSTIHRAVAEAPPGAVLVIDGEGHRSRAVWGFVLTMAALRRDAAGAVIDGTVRDIDEIRSVAFPLYARGVCPVGPHKGFEGRHGHVVQCGGVSVAPGDLVLGDADGVVVVPSARLGEIFAKTQQKRIDEAHWLERIAAGDARSTSSGSGDWAIRRRSSGEWNR